MKVKLLKTGSVEEHEYSYALRLIEQGKAVVSPEEKPAKKEKPKPADR